LRPIGLDQHPHDVAFLHDQVLDAVDLDLGSRPFAEQNPVPGLDVDRDELAALVAAARPDGDDFAQRERRALSGPDEEREKSARRLCDQS
jgi:hypothetical protein